MSEDNWEKMEFDSWSFEENDTLIGVFVEKREDVGPNHSNAYEFELKDGNRVTVWGSTVLDTRLKSLVIGEEVKIVYLGKEKSQQRKGAEYKNFDVFHRPAPMKKVEVEEEDPAAIFDADE